MRPDEWRRPTEELGKVPAELKPHHAAFNSQIESLTTVLLGKTSFKDNFNAQEFSVTAKHNTELEFKSTVRGTPKMLLLTWTGHYSPWYHAWRVVDSTTVAITVYWLDSPATTNSYTVKGILFGE